MARQCRHNTRVGEIVLDGRKAAFLPISRTLLVGDLHFEKGSFLQMNGHAPLPAYDTMETLSELGLLIKDYAPSHIAVLGDSFHDEAAGERLSRDHFETINHLVNAVPRFTWILGNHDPSIPKGLKGAQEDHLVIDNFLLTHLPTSPEKTELNICGHLHPKVKFSHRRRSFSKPCFAVGDDRIILPSFGAYTGGLYVNHPAIQSELAEPRHYFMTMNDDIFLVPKAA